jgi:hypothetical protein
MRGEISNERADRQTKDGKIGDEIFASDGSLVVAFLSVAVFADQSLSTVAVISLQIAAIYAIAMVMPFGISTLTKREREQSPMNVFM